jgi:hypothetical protein
MTTETALGGLVGRLAQADPDGRALTCGQDTVSRAELGTALRQRAWMPDPVRALHGHPRWARRPIRATPGREAYPMLSNTVEELFRPQAAGLPVLPRSTE